MSAPSDESFRWQAFFQQSSQPIFLVNRRRRILFVNHAWAACTGIPLAEARGQVCRRRSTAAIHDRADAVLSACTPPPEAMRGEMCQARRRPVNTGDLWEIQYFPIWGKQDLLGVLGMIRPLTTSAQAGGTLPEKLLAVRDRQQARYRLEYLGASSVPLRRLQEQARLAAVSSVPAMILGAAGAGKEWLAHAIHAAGDRRQQYFVSLDASRLPGDRVGSFLFGPRRAKLGLGTVYLRNADHLPREWQGRIAETLALGEDRDFPRLLIGMRDDPLDSVRAGRLLEDFHGATSTLTLMVPPLRERRAELPALIDVLLRQMQTLRHSGSGVMRQVSAEAMSVLESYAWPENVRELQEVLRGGDRRAKGERIELADLPFHLRHGPLPVDRHLPLDVLLEKVETRLITLAMRLADNNHTRAAELLEIWRPRLLRRLEKLNSDSEKQPLPKTDITS